SGRYSGGVRRCKNLGGASLDRRLKATGVEPLTEGACTCGFLPWVASKNHSGAIAAARDVRTAAHAQSDRAGRRGSAVVRNKAGDLPSVEYCARSYVIPLRFPAKGAAWFG